MNDVAMFIGYAVLFCGSAMLLYGLYDYFEAAKWYYTRFNSNNIHKIEDVIYDANLRIEQLQKAQSKHKEGGE